MPEWTPDEAADATLAMGWMLWFDAGHDKCSGWTFDSRSGDLTCACGAVIFRLSEVPA